MARQTILNAVVTLLEAVSGIGQVEDRPGATPPWIANQREKQALWEVSVTAHSASHYAGSAGGNLRNLERTWRVRIDGWMPKSRQDPNSYATWRNLLDAVELKLIRNPTLGGVTNEAEGDRNVPQTVFEEEAFFSDGEKEPLAHHAVIEFEATTTTTYSVEA